jgi:hypothetical protein
MGITYWNKGDYTSHGIARVDARYLPKKQLTDAVFYQHADGSSPSALERLHQALSANGIESYFDVLSPDSPIMIDLKVESDAQRNELLGMLRAAPFTGIRALRLAEGEASIRLEGRLSSHQWSQLEGWLAERNIHGHRTDNTLRTPVLRARIPGVHASEAAADMAIETLLMEHGLVAGHGEREPEMTNPLQKLQAWRRRYPSQSSGYLYVVPNLGQALSGLVRGNMGEFWSGVLYTLSNLDLGLGPRGNRSADKIVDEALDDFRHDGKIDLDKNRGFTSGNKRFGALVANYLGWREVEGNEISSKALLVLAAGASAFIGALRGKKQLVLDENGDVSLGSDGRPNYAYEQDIALLYDGGAAMVAYVPQAIMPSPRYNAPPLIDVAPLVKPVAKAPGISSVLKAAGQTSAGKKISDTYDYVAADPTRTTGNIMASRNILHMGYATYDGFVGIPQKIAAYDQKRLKDAFRLLTPEGGEGSLHGQMSQHLGVSKLIDASGQLTVEARQAGQRVVAEYEGLKSELAGLGSGKRGWLGRKQEADLSRQEALKQQLAEKDLGYQLALVLGSFDVDDKNQHRGMPMINRTLVPGSYQKLIDHHEAKLRDPYHPVERGGLEERLYVMALNRKFADELRSSRHMPWLRLFYSVFNFTAARELARFNKAVVNDPALQNQAEKQLDTQLLYQSAAESLQRHASKDNGDALARAAHNMASKLEGERELKRAGIGAHEIEAGILAALKGEPADRMLFAQQLAAQQPTVRNH